MRSIINISLPEELSRMVKKEVKKGNFASTSEYFRYLLKSRNNGALAKRLLKDKTDLESGKIKAKELTSFKDLM